MRKVEKNVLKRNSILKDSFKKKGRPKAEWKNKNMKISQAYLKENALDRKNENSDFIKMQGEYYRVNLVIIV